MGSTVNKLGVGVPCGSGYPLQVLTRLRCTQPFRAFRYYPSRIAGVERTFLAGHDNGEFFNHIPFVFDFTRSNFVALQNK